MSYYYLLGYRAFKSESQIKGIVLDYLISANSNLSNENLLGDDLRNKFDTTNLSITKLHALKIFQTSKQQTWIVSGYGVIFCLLDDIQVDIGKDFELIKWIAKISDIKDNISLEDAKLSEKFGLINFGTNHKHWYYSKNLLSSDEMAKQYIKNLVVSGSTE